MEAACCIACTCCMAAEWWAAATEAAESVSRTDGDALRIGGRGLPAPTESGRDRSCDDDGPPVAAAALCCCCWWCRWRSTEAEGGGELLRLRRRWWWISDWWWWWCRWLRADSWWWWGWWWPPCLSGLGVGDRDLWPGPPEPPLATESATDEAGLAELAVAAPGESDMLNDRGELRSLLLLAADTCDCWIDEEVVIISRQTTHKPHTHTHKSVSLSSSRIKMSITFLSSGYEPAMNSIKK